MQYYSRAALLQIIAVVIATAASFSALGALLTGNILAILATGASTIALALIAIVLLLVAVYVFLLPSAKSFASWRPAEFSTPSKLLRIGFLWGVNSSTNSATASTNILVLVALAVAVIGVILVIIGGVGLIICFFRLRDAFNSTLFLVAAILTILIIVPAVGGILGFIAWILVLVESGTIMKRIESGEIKL